MNSLLLQELGFAPEDKSITWSDGLEKRVLLSRKKKDLPMEYTNIVYDKKLRATVYGLQAKGLDNDSTRIEFFMKSKGFGPPEPWRSPAPQISSMSLSSSGILFVTRVGGGYAAAGVKINSDAATPAAVFGTIDEEFLTTSPGASFWASTANPYSKDTSFAVAASDGAFILNESQGRWTVDDDVGWSFDRSDVRAVDWLEPTVVIKGCKDGAVRLWDIRNGDEVARIQHPSQVNHAKRIVNETRIVVAGLHSQLCTYDLRYLSGPATSGQVTNPYNKFPIYHNVGFSHMAAGFDVHGDLFAAATDDGRVIIGNGKDSFDVTAIEWKDGAACLRFIDEEKEGKALRLMGTAGESIIEYAW